MTTDPGGRSLPRHFTLMSFAFVLGAGGLLAGSRAAIQSSR
jgi:hypothetical protein